MTNPYEVSWQAEGTMVVFANEIADAENKALNAFDRLSAPGVQQLNAGEVILTGCSYCSETDEP